MIRFIVGLILLMGAAGGSDTGTATFLESIIWSVIGLALMAWPTFDGTLGDTQ